MAKTHRHDDEIRVDELSILKRWDISGTLVLSTAAELNVLDGITAVVEELNLLNNQVASATIVVGTEVPNVINVTVQFIDAEGTDMATPVAVPWYLADDAAGLNPATVAHSAGASIGTDGALIESIANLSGLMISEVDGDVDIDFEETGSLTKYLVLVMPTGALIISDAITH